jgi:hypothetical protein
VPSRVITLSQAPAPVPWATKPPQPWAGIPSDGPRRGSTDQRVLSDEVTRHVRADRPLHRHGRRDQGSAAPATSLSPKNQSLRLPTRPQHCPQRPKPPRFCTFSRKQPADNLSAALFLLATRPLGIFGGGRRRAATPGLIQLHPRPPALLGLRYTRNVRLYAPISIP